MSSDDFGTINVRRGERTRELEVLRQHYRQHRDALLRMIADAPTEHLASEYQRLVAEIDRALGKLDELEGRPAAAAAVPPPQHEPTRPHGDPLAAQRPRTHDAASRPLVTPAGSVHDDYSLPPGYPGEGESRSRLPLIIGAAVLALALIGALIWWASSDRDPAAGAIVEDTAAATDTAADTAVATDDTIEPAATPRAAGLAAAPQTHDYGVIRKGTRATRQFEIANNTDEPVTINVARSACRCLFYEHAPVVPPRGKESLTVTVDGARAKGGELREAIRVASKSDPSVGTTFNVTATIR